MDAGHGVTKNKFAFDFMYGPDATQEEVRVDHAAPPSPSTPSFRPLTLRHWALLGQVYRQLGAPLLDKAFGGFNATIFACALSA